MKTWTVTLCVLLAGAAHATTLEIHHLDVDQADATLIVAPNGRTLLIDAGKTGDARTIKRFMDAHGLTTIDAFVATHYHDDHYGGIDDLKALGVPIHEAYDRGDKDDMTGPRFTKYQADVGEDAELLEGGDPLDIDSSVQVLCISSSGRVPGQTDDSDGHNENDKSISLLISFGGFRYFIGADIEKPTEEKIAALDLVGDVDVYRANHHGAETSSTDAFMRDLKPSVIIISNGSHANHLHPRQSTLDTFATLPGPPVVFQTNKCHHQQKCGNVPDAYIADPETTDTDGTVSISVDENSGSYAITYGSTSHSFVAKAAAQRTVVITSLLPNPPGSDTDNEEVTLANHTSSTVTLAGWRLRDRSGKRWDLSAVSSIAPNESRVVRRGGQAMSLNNAGDRISLIDADSVVRDVYAYIGSSEGQVITTGH